MKAHHNMIQPVPQSERPGELAPLLDWANPRRVVLNNGLTLLIGTLPHLCTASMGLYVRVGSRYERSGEYGLSHLVEHLLFRGCEGAPTSRALNEAIESLTPGLDASTGREFTALEALCAPEDLHSLLALVGKMVSAPHLADVDAEREIILQEIADEVDPDGRDVDVDNVAKAALFPGDGLGRKIGGDPRSLRRLRREDCLRWLESHYAAENMVLVVVHPDAQAPVADWAEAAFEAVQAGAGKV
ncbi:MAG: pitrilysin family protein, partial [Myxococcota bacterium]|nr:pitrilysin family protein [Myxococcota bacterium]